MKDLPIEIVMVQEDMLLDSPLNNIALKKFPGDWFIFINTDF